MSAHEEAQRLTPREELLVNATAAAVVKAFQASGCAGACGLSGEKRQQMGHLVGMVTDIGIERTRERLLFVGRLMEGTNRATLVILSTALAILTGGTVYAVWEHITRGPK